MTTGRKRTRRKAAPDIDHAIVLFREMLRIRIFEERAAELYQEGKIRGFLHLYIGEEAIAVGAMQALTPEDAIISTYREHGHALARGLPSGELMAELFGKSSGSSHGRGGSMHIFDASRRFYGGYAIVGGGLPLAVGLALADKMRGKSPVTACFFGEGAADEGEFHESLNLAAVWKLPVLFICENNLYSLGTPLANAESQTDISAKARSYNIPAEAADGMNVVAVEAATRRASEAIRRGEGPQFLEFRTYRFRGHSMSDPELYRSHEEVDKWKELGPIVTFREHLRDASMLSESALEQIEKKVDAEMTEAIAFAEESGWEPVGELRRHVTSELPHD